MDNLYLLYSCRIKVKEQFQKAAVDFLETNSIPFKQKKHCLKLDGITSEQLTLLQDVPFISIKKLSVMRDTGELAGQEEQAVRLHMSRPLRMETEDFPAENGEEYNDADYDYEG